MHCWRNWNSGAVIGYFCVWEQMEWTNRNKCKKPKWWEITKQPPAAGAIGLWAPVGGCHTMVCGAGVTTLCSAKQGNLRAAAAFSQVSSPGLSAAHVSPLQEDTIRKIANIHFIGVLQLSVPSLWRVVPPRVDAHSLETSVRTCITPLCAFPLFICCLLLCSALPWRSQHFSKQHRVVLPIEPFSLFPWGTESHFKKRKPNLVLAGPLWHFFLFLNNS